MVETRQQARTAHLVGKTFRSCTTVPRPSGGHARGRAWMVLPEWRRTRNRGGRPGAGERRAPYAAESTSPRDCFSSGRRSGSAPAAGPLSEPGAWPIGSECRPGGCAPGRRWRLRCGWPPPAMPPSSFSGAGRPSVLNREARSPSPFPALDRRPGVPGRERVRRRTGCFTTGSKTRRPDGGPGAGERCPGGRVGRESGAARASPPPGGRRSPPPARPAARGR